jgi:hypothetical protein
MSDFNLGSWTRVHQAMLGLTLTISIFAGIVVGMAAVDAFEPDEAVEYADSEELDLRGTLT